MGFRIVIGCDDAGIDHKERLAADLREAPPASTTSSTSGCIAAAPTSTAPPRRSASPPLKRCGPVTPTVPC